MAAPALKLGWMAQAVSCCQGGSRKKTVIIREGG